MANIKNNSHNMDVIVVLCLFVVFSITILSVLFYGVHAYRNISAKSDANYGVRTSLLYISNKVHAYDEENKVTVGNFGDGEALFLEESFEGVAYVTKIYTHEGQLMELFAEAGIDIDPVGGTRITELQSLKVQEKEENLLEVTVESKAGVKNTMVIRTH